MTDYLPITRIKPVDKEFSLGLTYYEIMDLPEDGLNRFLQQTPREEIIDWLQWNDPNGVYRDEDSMREFDNILSKEEGMEIIKRQILQF
jgi:hypothetical protein